MMRWIMIVLVSSLILGGCSSSDEVEAVETASTAPIRQGVNLISAAPAELAMETDHLPNGCQTSGEGIERPNSGVLVARNDGEEYLAASRRIDGWQIQFDCAENPRLVINVVVTYETLEGAAITLSRRWHGEVWERIDGGELELLPNIEGLGDLQLVFQDANGTIGVEFVYRNVYIFLTGTADEGVDNYEYFAELASRYRQRIVGNYP